MGLIALGALMILLIQWAAVGNAATTVYFWLFSIVAIVASARVITHRKPVYSALYFVLVVFASAGLFVLMWAEFLAAALVIIYAGAILVTYTFVIMLASEASGQGIVTGLAGASSGDEFDHDVESRSPMLACFAGFVVMGTLLFLIFDRATTLVAHGPIQPDATGNIAGGLQQLGVYLFTHQSVALQMAGLILTLAMVGALMIARKKVLLSEEEMLTNLTADNAPHTPIDDNPHSISVFGEAGPRTRKRDREMAEL